jgi:hypothetical protein
LSKCQLTLHVKQLLMMLLLLLLVLQHELLPQLLIMSVVLCRVYTA